MPHEALLVILGWPVDPIDPDELEHLSSSQLPWYADGAITQCEACRQAISVGRRQHHAMQTCSERRVLCVGCYLRGLDDGTFTCASVLRLDQGTGPKPC